MDAKRIDLVLKFALAAAAREDEPWLRELGAIHLLKLLYLADLEFAARNDGKTFTGVDWRFYHYGPWSAEAFGRIAPVIAVLPVEEKIFSSPKYEKDSVRWTICDRDAAEELFDSSDGLLPLAVTSAVKSAVHRFGSDTTALLHFVYSTEPMTGAAPGEQLVFHAKPREHTAIAEEPLRSVKQEKKRKEALARLQERTRTVMAQRMAKRRAQSVASPPRYDDVFEAGHKWLDCLAGGDAANQEGEVVFPDDIWKSPWRGPRDEH